MKKLYLLSLITLSITSCNREWNSSTHMTTENSSSIDGRGTTTVPIFASFNSNMKYSDSNRCNGSSYPIQINIDPNLPLILNPIAVREDLPFLSNVRTNYGILNREIANVIFYVYNSPKIQDYTYNGYDYQDFVSNPKNSNLLQEMEITYGQDGENASMYGDIFPYDKFMNQDIVNTMSHNIVHQIQSNSQNSNIKIKAIWTYQDSFLCIPTYNFLKIHIAYTNN